jgi:hypothetical protein
MPLPTKEQTFSYQGVEAPVLSSDPSQAMPIGLGSVAVGGDTFALSIGVGPFESPVDISLAFYIPNMDAADLFFLTSDWKIKRLSDAIREDEHSTGNALFDILRKRVEDPKKAERRRSRLVLWKQGVTAVNEDILSIPVSALPPGIYAVVLTVTAPDGQGNDDGFYKWITHVVVPGNNGDGHHDD